MIILWILLSSLIHHSIGATSPIKPCYETHNYYVLGHNSQLDSSSGASLDDVTTSLGVELIEQVGELQDHWLVRQPKPEGVILARDGSDKVLATFKALQDRAEAPHTARSEDSYLARRVVSSVHYLSPQYRRQRIKRAPPPPKISASRAMAARFGFADPRFPDQWHIVNDDFPEHMMNVSGVWEMGFKGQGVISSLVDDGLEYESEDLSANFDAEDSYDFNDHEKLPTPKKFDDHHGTRCAGQIAAGKNNVCGVGLAYESKVAGVRILSGPISDADEAAALNYGFQNVSIYSCSWGPPDNGQALEGPNYLIKKAFTNGINYGRDGKGSVFVFASGNGAHFEDQCNFDGYTNSIYSVTVSAVDYKGLHPYYSEPCAANMIVAYSSGSGRHIVTTDKGKNACSAGHGGTSAAAPNAAGVFALALQARPDLTWRDVQHLCVETAKIINPEDPDWEPTASGRLFSYKYGFGVLDAYRYVKAAQTWNLVKPQARIVSHTIQLNNGTFGEDELFQGGQSIGADGIQSTMIVPSESLAQNNFEALEHINVKVWISHATRGEVEVEIVSPNGIKSVLAAPRKADRATSGYPGWKFMSVKHWGENPIGNWTIKVKDQNRANSTGSFLGWNMVFWGSAIDASKAQKYEALVVENVLPPPDRPQNPVILPSTTMKQHPKPTANLPGDHGVAAGENTKPAFSTTTPTPTTTPIPTATPIPTSTSILDEITGTAGVGWFSGMSSLMTNQKWLFIALGVVLLFGIAAGIFFWRRHVANKAARYTELNEREMSVNPMGSSAASGGVRTTRELYDAFGQVSDEEDDGDNDDDNETTALRSARGGFDFDSNFLNDEHPSSDALEPSPGYRDDPEFEDEEREESQEDKQPLKVDVLSSEVGPSSPIKSGVAPSEHMPSQE